MSHELRRCLVVELGIANKISDADLDHVYFLCEQLYLDVLGYGINGRKP